MLASLDRVKRVMQIPPDDSSMDDMLLLLITASSQAIEDYCKRSFQKKLYMERMSGYSSLYLNLRNYPIHHIKEVRADQILGDYEEIGDGRLYRERGWPIGEQNISVTYLGGYVLPSEETKENPRTLPESLELACILYCQTLMRSPGVSAERVGDLSVSYANEGEGLPLAVKSLVNPYRRWL
ncbi:phage head-tail connector protein [Brevibacillus reuszeri]|uniref:phage head-tail connector protein n=1 Tax=Brevibacillus reuszeri TaxID=54915 RepID=UPI0028A0CACA|nr:phage head-tail connector protein [Brevibacillus reuszeri]